MFQILICAGLAQARHNGKGLGRPATAAARADEARKPHRAGISKSEIARQPPDRPYLSAPDSGATYFREKSAHWGLRTRAENSRYVEPGSSHPRSIS